MQAKALELLTPQQMAQADALTIASGISEAFLIKQAGRAVTQAILRRFAARPTIILAGPGNNGADAREVYAHLKSAYWPVRLIESDQLRPESIKNARLVIDGIFGAGLSRPISGAIADLIHKVNDANLPVIAIDVPSGLDGASGQIKGVCFNASLTVTFFRLKPGHLLLPGRQLCGEVELCDISISENVLSEIAPQTFRNAPGLWQLPQKSLSSHKYHHGHALILSGPGTHSGAAKLSATACLHSGAGLVTIAAPSSAQAELAANLGAIMQQKADNSREFAAILHDKRFTSCLIGPGAGITSNTRQIAEMALLSGRPVVLDADALSVFSGDIAHLQSLIKIADRPVILTPHEGEFSRLFNRLQPISESKTERARTAAKASNAIILLKGADTVIAHPDGRAAINNNAPAWLAQAGSGDVLAGIITALLGQSMDGFSAACAGAYLHGQAAQRLGPGLGADHLARACFPTGNSEMALL